MATVDHQQTESSFTSDAVELLGCFSYGFDDVISRIAEHEAARRSGHIGAEVTVDDVMSAVNVFITSMKSSDLPAQMKPEIDAMLSCLSRKLGQSK